MKNETERLKLRQKYRNEVNPVLAEKHVPKDTYTFTDDYVFWLEEQLVKNIEVIPCCGDVVCGNCDGYGYTVDENGRRKEHCKECE